MTAMQSFRRALLTPVGVLTVVAFYVFAGWQAFNHLYLMRLPMLTYHLVSLIVETIGAGLVAFFVIRALLRKNQQLEDLDRQKQLLTNALVHDLRQPLTALLGGLYSAMEYGRLSDEAKNLLYPAQLGAADLLSMVNDLLDIARLEAGHNIINAQEIAPADFIRAGIEDVTQLAWSKDLIVSTDLLENIPHVNADPAKLRRVVMNLVANAVKFTPSQGRISVQAKADADDDRVLVSVADTGEGIPKEHQQRIFDKFATIDARRSGDRSSTGLGLTFCKMVVEAHGGEIWVESEPDKGSTFTFSLPIAGAAS